MTSAASPQQWSASYPPTPVLSKTPNETNNSLLSGSSTLYSHFNRNQPQIAAGQSEPKTDDSYPVYYVSSPEETNKQQQSSQSYSNPKTSQSALQQQSNSNGLVEPGPSKGDSYPVYYVSNPEETNRQQQSSQSISNSSTSQSTFQQHSNSNSVEDPGPSKSDSYPVYYVSNPEEPNTQPQPSQRIFNSKANQSIASSSPSQSGKDNEYPVYYVKDNEKNEERRLKANSIIKTLSLPTNSTNNSATNSHGHHYPVYYVSTYNKEAEAPEAPEAPKATDSNSFVPGSPFVSEQGGKAPLYNVGDSNVGSGNLGQESKTKPAADSPVTYKIINSSSTSQDTTKSKNKGIQSATLSAASVTESSSFQPPSQPEAALNSHPSNPSPPSSQHQGYSNYGSPEYPSPQTAYQTYGASSPTANWASQSASSYNGHPAYRPPAVPSSDQSAPSSSYYAAAPAPSSSLSPSSYGVSTVASSSRAQSSETQQVFSPYSPTNAPIPSPAPAPSSSPYSISDVSSSSSFSSGFQSTLTYKNHQSHSVQVSNTSYKQISSSENGNSHPTDADFASSSLPVLQAEYENSSYIIATPPDKDTVLFLPSSSFPSSLDADQDENSLRTSSSVDSESSPAYKNTTYSSHAAVSVNTKSTNKMLQPQNNTAITGQAVDNSSVALSSPESPTGIEEAANFPIIRIPENVTMPGWKLEDVTITNATFLSNSSMELPPINKVGNQVGSTTSTTQSSPSRTSPIVTLPSAASSSNSKTASSDTFNIPLGPLLDSLAATTQPGMTKPPRSRFLTTPSPKRAPYTATKKPQVAFHPTTKPAGKKKEWGFGDKYLGEQ